MGAGRRRFAKPGEDNRTGADLQAAPVVSLALSLVCLSLVAGRSLVLPKIREDLRQAIELLSRDSVSLVYDRAKEPGAAKAPDLGT